MKSNSSAQSVPNGMKKCSKCGKIKRVTEFSKRSDLGSKSKLMSACKPCNREKSKRWRTKNPGKHKEGIYRWRKNNPESYRRLTAKYRAENPLNLRASKMVGGAKALCKEEGLPFDIDFDFILKKLQAGTCECTGLRFSLSEELRNACSPSIDRVVPNLGYVKGNVRIIVWALNAFKNNFSDKDIYPIAKAFCKAYEKDPG